MLNVVMCWSTWCVGLQR